MTVPVDDPTVCPSCGEHRDVFEDEGFLEGWCPPCGTSWAVADGQLLWAVARRPGRPADEPEGG